MNVKTTSGIRIIGGKWRRRQIPVPHSSVVRPTPNRVRETVFNWLMSDIQDAICLDAYAGSGALGFEALSRGACHVTFVEADRNVVKQLKKTASALGARNSDIIHARFPDEFSCHQQFNIVFLDPPFHQSLIIPCLNILLQKNCLAPNAFIYIEAEKSLGNFLLPENLSLKKYKVAGKVGHYLVVNGVPAYNGVTLHLLNVDNDRLAF